MNVGKIGSLALCLLVAGLVTAESDNSGSVKWRATFVPGEPSEGIEEVRDAKLPIDPGFSQPASTGQFVVPVKTKNDETVNPGGLRSVFSALVVVVPDLANWVSKISHGLRWRLS